MSPAPRYGLLLFLFTNFALLLISTSTVNALGWGGAKPSETECRPYIEKALKEQLGDPTSQEAAESTPPETPPAQEPPPEEPSNEETASQEGSVEITEETPEAAESDEEPTGQSEQTQEGHESGEVSAEQSGGEESTEAQADEPTSQEESVEESQQVQEETTQEAESEEQVSEETQSTTEPGDEELSEETEADNVQDKSAENQESAEDADVTGEESTGESAETVETEQSEEAAASEEETTQSAEESEQGGEEQSDEEHDESAEPGQESAEQESGENVEESKPEESGENEQSEEEPVTQTAAETESAETTEPQSEESQQDSQPEEGQSQETEEPALTETESSEGSPETNASQEETIVEESEAQQDASPQESQEESTQAEPEAIASEEETVETEQPETEAAPSEGEEEAQSAGGDATPEEDLTLDVIIPDKLRPRDHLAEILRLGPDAAETEVVLSKTIDVTLRELKRLYDNAIKPLEMLYKYRDLSNRHFGDPEIFSKPLVLFMGPWSGGKSTIINYLLDNQYSKTALRTGAEPSPAYFNIVMWGEDAEILDGTQLAADWTFSGLQKFGQGLLDRLRGLKLKNPLLEKVNIVEIPGILEIRKQVERLFPFNDACQWFIDRADIIFLVYDPSKLDVGPETEAILDQLKGREYQTRIILNKADQIKPEELMRVQGTLIWNISPLMSSPEPPVMYSTSLWAIPYEIGSPARLLHAQEKAFLRDLREAIDKRVENKIASARRFAVRVRNHAKMVDCYLTTFYNHKTFFGNRKHVADDIIEHPQNYHIYEGLSTLTNISRYDLPDPEVYRDFFRLNPVYEFQQLAATCTYFRGCPINRLDIAIAYDLPELVGKYKKSAEQVLVSSATQKSKS